MKLRFPLKLSVLIMFFISGLLSAQDSPKGTMRRKGKKKEDRIIKYAKWKYRKEYRAIQVLRKTDPEAYQAKLKEFKAKIAKEIPENWRPKGRKDAACTAIWNRYSDELANLRKLRQSDPKAFKEKQKAFHAKIRKEIIEERKKFLQLVKDYRKNKDPETLAKIKKYISDIYDRNIAITAKRLAQQRQKLEKAEKALEAKKADKEKFIEKKLKRLIRDPRLNW